MYTHTISWCTVTHQTLLQFVYRSFFTQQITKQLLVTYTGHTITPESSQACLYTIFADKDTPNTFLLYVLSPVHNHTPNNFSVLQATFARNHRNNLPCVYRLFLCTITHEPQKQFVSCVIVTVADNYSAPHIPFKFPTPYSRPLFRKFLVVRIMAEQRPTSSATSIMNMYCSKF